ncbi:MULTISPECIES: hypothetical protein [unclassified Rhizobium]|nr:MULTISPECIES: hypothetical protein [unclassified Rhizobium]MDM9622975.1 hypothetical protein [Rhizobium sp. S96]
MMTPIPPEITTPDRLDTRIGNLDFNDGVGHGRNRAEGLGPA